ncbi:hypothetical protein [Bacillus xiapuensis]|uniref:Uncharacterized protein n=1 Tax=Bacillus xiapuensis TaxID=2014075 RepID=A0ABU6NAK6_9BACI|nr:hypothetical protein [Bacillus xiapuensis]
MTDKKVIYDNGSSNLSIEFDGEIVVLKQETKGIENGSIYMYADEFEKAFKFIKDYEQEQTDLIYDSLIQILDEELGKETKNDLYKKSIERYKTIRR